MRLNSLKQHLNWRVCMLDGGKKPRVAPVNDGLIATLSSIEHALDDYAARCTRERRVNCYLSRRAASTVGAEAELPHSTLRDKRIGKRGRERSGGCRTEPHVVLVVSRMPDMTYAGQRAQWVRKHGFRTPHCVTRGLVNGEGAGLGRDYAVDR
jgi:hypothetical protein